MKTFLSLLPLPFITLLTSIPSSHALASSNEETNLIQKTCNQTGYYDLCVKSLQSDPRSSRAKNVKGLAQIMLNIVLVTTNESLYHAGKLFKESNDPLLNRFYGTCIEEFQGAVERHIPGAIAALDSNDLKSSSQDATDTATSAMACEEQFASKTPLTDENNYVHDLSLVASNIINLLS